MKKTILALAIAATTAQADVKYGDKYNTVYGSSERYSDTAFNVRLSPLNGCRPTLNFFTETDRSDSKGSTSFKVVVDRHEHWNITDATMTTRDGVEVVSSNTNPKFINELRRGKTLRVQWEMASGALAYDSFSLIGFSAAYAKAKIACKPTSDYFNKPSTSNEAELFL